MADPDANSIIAKAVDWLWAIALGAIGLLWNANQKKLDELSVRINGKADNNEVSRLTLSIAALERDLNSDRREAQQYREKMQERMQTNHQELLSKLDHLWRQK